MEPGKLQLKPLSGESDWPMWKYRIKFALNYYTDALEVVLGKIVKPDQPLEGSTEATLAKYREDLMCYKKANNCAMMVLTNSMTEDTMQKIMRFDDAREVWLELTKLFEATSDNQLYSICMQFFQFKWTVNDTMAAHLSKLKNLWNELNLGLERKEEAQLPEMLLICKILDTLPQEYRSFKSSWLLLNEDKRTIDELTTQLCSQERENKEEKSKGDVHNQEALEAKASRTGAAFKSKKHIGKCNYCHQSGHWVKSCRKWIADGRPPKPNQNDRITRKDGTANMSLLAVHEDVFSSEEKCYDWFVDNGASKHITNNSNYFTAFEKFKTPHGITAANGKVLPAIGKGTLRIMTTIEGEERQFKDLQDVWLVPDISKNLFSVLAAQDRNKNSTFESTAEECWLKINNKRVLYGTRNISGGLYKVHMKVLTPNNPVEVNVATTSDSILQLYHERWGHQNKRHIKNVLEQQMDLKVGLDNELCEACIYGKAHRLKFGNRQKATRPGELISTDVCGPFDASCKRYRYFVVFKDHFTKFRYVFFLRQKSEVAQALKDMLAHAKNLGHNIREILSDNGGEFDNECVKTILQKRGIIQRLTAPYTPQQNGGSERENRTLVEMARTLKNSNPEINFPSCLWAELISTSVYILNRTGKSSLPNASPYESWMGQKPRLRHMRIIGSTCYAHIPDQKRRKMDKKAIKGFLLGYDGDERYRIWIKETNTVICSRDVIFQEKPLKNCEDPVEIPLLEPQRPEDKNEVKHDQGSPEDQTTSESENEGKHDQEVQEDETSSESEDDDSTSAMKLRSHSGIKKPKRFEDYVMAAEVFMSDVNEPELYQDAVNCKENNFWKKAMDSEISSLKENNTWSLEALPDKAKALPCKWVFRIKKNPDGSIDKYKARLVIKGFKQKQGIDYNQTFSPVTKLGTVRSLISIAASEKMHLMQFDVSTAFLYGDLDEVIYMEQPEGYSDGTSNVCKLKKSLYGLKQAPRCWHKCFGKFMLDLGFKISEADQCLFIREEGGKKLLVALYVDDGLIAATDEEDSRKFINELKLKFKITSKPASYFLGLEIEHLEDGSVKIGQEAYATKVLQRFGMSDCRPVHTPILKEKEVCTEETNETEFPYREAVGALMYLMMGTRPDLAYSISVLSRKLENPSKEDWMKVKRIFRYIASSMQKCIIYKSGFKPGVLECFSDADFGGCMQTGRSTSGVAVLYAGGAISWLSQRQAMVATSTTEAEIVAANEAAKELIWLKRLISGVSFLKEIPTIHVDNSAAVRLAQNPEFHRRTKHISLKHFFIREKVLEGEIDVQQISTEMQLADLMTKPLHKPRLLMLCEKMGLI